MPSAASLMVSILAGVFGLAYFVYGKRQEKIAFLVAGVCLCAAPYLFDSIALEILVSLGLLAVPFILDR